MEVERYMRRALELARLGAGSVSPNPMVGAVIVSQDGRIIGEGWHQVYGGAHAEVNAVRSVEDCGLLDSATMYVTLEPCAHWGKTPPCVDLIIAQRIPNVVIGTVDPYCEVCGEGVKRLQDAGVNVIVGVLEAECRRLNAPFFTSHTLCRPYIILKWAQTVDGYLDALRPLGSPAQWFTGNVCRTLVHRWRAECDAIMVGRRTVEMDNPSLTVRNWKGENPMRITLDSNLRLSTDHAIFSADATTILFTRQENQAVAVERFSICPNVEIATLDYSAPILPQVLQYLYVKRIQSLFVEGGAELLNQFIADDLYDEVRIFTSEQVIAQIYDSKYGQGGVKAPQIPLDDCLIRNNKPFGLTEIVRTPTKCSG